MPTIEHNVEADGIPTRKQSPSGKWIVAVDRGARRLEAAIALLEEGADVADVLDELREAHKLVNGGTP